MMIKRTGWKNLNWIKDRRRQVEKGKAIREIKDADRHAKNERGDS
jgi:hypothetical protein